MKRRFFNLAAGVSIILCLALGALDYWSYSHLAVATKWFRADGSAVLFLYLSRGKVEFCLMHLPRAHLGPDPIELEILPPADLSVDGRLNPGEIRRQFAGFSYFSSPDDDPENTHSAIIDHRRETTHDVMFPMWGLIVLASISPLFWLRSHRKRKRHRPGFCRSCGYDLRVTPGRCPECGRGDTVAG